MCWHAGGVLRSAHPARLDQHGIPRCKASSHAHRTSGSCAYGATGCAVLLPPGQRGLTAARVPCARTTPQLWEAHLQGRTYLVGGAFTMADVAFFPNLAYNVRLGLNISCVATPGPPLCVCVRMCACECVCVPDAPLVRVRVLPGGTPTCTRTTSTCASGPVSLRRGRLTGAGARACPSSLTPCPVAVTPATHPCLVREVTMTQTRTTH